MQKKTFFSSFFLWNWAPQGTIMMACSLPMKSRERLTCDVLDTFAKHSCRVHDLNDADCWAQNGSTHSSVFTTAKHQVSNRYPVKNCCAQNSSTQEVFMQLWNIHNFFFNNLYQIPSEKLPCVNLSFHSYQYSLWTVSIYYKLSLFTAQAMILTCYIFTTVNKLCLNQYSQFPFNVFHKPV